MYSRILSVSLVVTILGADVISAQSLGGLAQQEEERRKAVAVPSKVITDKDLRPVPAGTTPVPGASSSSPSGVGAIADGDRIAVAAAQYRGGAVPQIPTQATGGGEVLLELTVSSEGRVVAVKALRHSPPYTNALQEAVLTWQFRPAEDGAVPKPGEPVDPTTRKPVESKVLVAGMFRPPALYAATLGEPPKDVAVPSDEIPFPVTPAKMPLYPPLSVGDGVVMAELRVGPDGRLVDATVVRSNPGFDQSALDAVQQWAFRPARVHGLAVAKFAYFVAVFRAPVVRSNDQRPNPNRP